MIARIKKLGAVYLYGVAMFAIGASAGAFMGFSIAEATFLTLLKSKGLL